MNVIMILVSMLVVRSVGKVVAKDFLYMPEETTPTENNLFSNDNNFGFPNSRRKLLGGAASFPGVHPITVGDDYYVSDYCKEPPKKLNLANHQYIVFNTTITKPKQVSKSLPAAPNVIFGQDPNAGRRRLMGKKTPKYMGRPPGWSKGHPNAVDFATIREAVVNKDKGFCGFRTKECVVPGVKGYTLSGVKGAGKFCCSGKDKSCCRVRKNVRFETPPISEEEWETLPSVPKGWWGSCALVALGDCMMRTKKGPEIDAHDLVIRIGHAPVDRFIDHVGSRTDVVFSRGASTRMQRSMSFKNAPKFYIGSAPSYVNVPSFHPNGVDYPEESYVEEYMKSSPGTMAGRLYEQMTTPYGGKPRGATSGFSMALRLVFSGVCERLDLYGFSENGGYAYYDKNSMKIHHSAELESFVFHHLMRNFSNELHTCVHI